MIDTLKSLHEYKHTDVKEEENYNNLLFVVFEVMTTGLQCRI